MSRLRRGLAALAVLLALPAAAAAAEGGTASGRYAREGLSLSFSHAMVLAQDNAEGALDRPRQVRLLLSDVEVPLAALEGPVFPPVRDMARAGQVRGLLIEFDPADRTSLQATVLAKPEPGETLATLSLSNTSGLWRRLELGTDRASGEFGGDAEGNLAFVFDAPILTDPVVADLSGAEARASEPVRVLVARAQAIGRADLAGALALSARHSNVRSLPPDQIKTVAGQAAGMIAEFKSAKHVVVRRDTATVVLQNGGMASLVREDGVWKAAD